MGFSPSSVGEVLWAQLSPAHELQWGKCELEGEDSPAIQHVMTEPWSHPVAFQFLEREAPGSARPPWCGVPWLEHRPGGAVQVGAAGRHVFNEAAVSLQPMHG